MWLEIIKSFLYIALELTVLFVLISLFVTVIQGFIPYEKMKKYLSGNNVIMGAAVALAFAFVTPFCSCSTIPVVVNLLNNRVRFGIVMIFLFASPVLDPTIITLMAAILGVKVAITYTVVTAVLSVAIGFTLERLGFEKQVKQVVMTGYEESEKPFSLKYVLSETVKMMKTVYPYLLIGAGVGSIIQGFVPTQWISTYLGDGRWWMVPVAAVVGIPLYIRLSTMIPISQILIMKGMALAPVMSLMISSAGASLPELILLNSIFRKKLVGAFVLSVFSMSTLSGLLFYII